MNEMQTLSIAPHLVLKGDNILTKEQIISFGDNPLLVGGKNSLPLVETTLSGFSKAYYSPDCSDSSLARLVQEVQSKKSNLIVGVGGGKALDTAKILAHKTGIPIVTIPTSAATCAAWTALGNIYTDEGAFSYDVPLPRCPDLLILDYQLILQAPKRTLVSGIGDAIAKWYESSISSGDSSDSLTITAVQSARVLRDLLWQKSACAVQNLGGTTWKEVVDATVLIAGVMGGLGGANCRTVAAHAVHNGLTHLSETHNMLHGEKVAYGILVQLRLEEIILSNQLAASSREQLLRFYQEIGLPISLEDLGLKNTSLTTLRDCADLICQPASDLHRLPFKVSSEQLLAAMVSTMAECKLEL